MSNKIVARWISEELDEFVVKCEEGLYYRRSYSCWVNISCMPEAMAGDASWLTPVIVPKTVENWINSGQLEEV